MQKTIRNAVSHIKFEQIVQKLYTQDICGGHLEFPLFVHSANYLQGCSPRLCTQNAVFVVVFLNAHKKMSKFPESQQAFFYCLGYAEDVTLVAYFLH